MPKNKLLTLTDGWLDKLSTSAGGTVADIDWEDNLEPLEEA